MNANKLLCRLLLLFPVFTLLQSFPLLRWINKALLICVIIVLLFLTVRKMKKRWAGILFTVVVVLDLGSSDFTSCGFDSHHRYQPLFVRDL